jgi:hypothetical protein
MRSTSAWIRPALPGRRQLDSSGRHIGAIAEVPGVSGGLHYNWDRGRAFDVNRGVSADAARNHVCGVATLPGDQAGVAFSPIWRLAMKIRFSRCTNNRRQKKEGIKNRGEDKFSCPLFFCPALLFTNLYWITTDILRPISLLQRLRDWLTPLD